jgi:uncharacterized protein YcfL
MPARLSIWLVCVTVLSLLVTGCGTGTPGVEVQESLPVMDSSVPSATMAPTMPPTATVAPTTTPLPSPIQLVVLHTNDNWGETEPCG